MLKKHVFVVEQASDEPAFLSKGVEVSAKYRGAFCEAKVTNVEKCVKCKVSRIHKIVIIVLFILVREPTRNTVYFVENSLDDVVFILQYGFFSADSYFQLDCE
jgi:hypothetical protein